MTQYKYDYTDDLTGTLIVCLKLILQSLNLYSTISDDKIDLLIYMLKNNLITQTELNDIPKLFSKYVNYDYISSKLIGLDHEIVKTMLKLFQK